MEKKKPTIDEIYKLNVDGLFESTANWFDSAYQKSQAEINKDLYNKINNYTSPGENTGGNANLGGLLTSLNNSNLYPSKGYLYYNGSNWEFNTPVISGGGGTIDESAITIAVNNVLSKTTWWGQKIANNKIDGPITISNGTKTFKIEVDSNGNLKFNGNIYATGGVTALGEGSSSGGSSGSSSTRYPFTIYNGSSDNDYITYDGSSAAYLKFKSGFSISKVGLGYEISASGSGGTGTPLSSVMSAMNSQLGKTSYGTPQFLYWNGSTYTWKNESEISGGSGSSSRIKKIKLFTNNSDSSFETVELGSADTIGFMAGDNVSLQAVVKEYTNVIKISANVSSSGGSSGSVDLSNYLTKTEASSTYAVKNHTHSAASITGFEDAARLVKVNNAKLADKANELNSSVILWGNTFYGSNNIGTTSTPADLRYVNNIYAGSTFDIKSNDKSLLRVSNGSYSTIYVGFDYKADDNASLVLFGNKTTIYTSGDDYRYDFTKGVFDVNTNVIHFGYTSSGGKISWDAANNAFKIEGNVYATGGITALGVSNSATTSNNVDFTFKNVTANSITANTFNVKNSIQISNKLKLSRDGDDVYLSSSDIGTYYMYIDGNDKNYYLTSNGDAHFNNLSCDYLDIPGAENFKIVDIGSTTFTIQFQYNGKTYEFTPSDSEVSVN